MPPQANQLVVGPIIMQPNLHHPRLADPSTMFVHGHNGIPDDMGLGRHDVAGPDQVEPSPGHEFPLAPVDDAPQLIARRRRTLGRSPTTADVNPGRAIRRLVGHLIGRLVHDMAGQAEHFEVTIGSLIGYDVDRQPTIGAVSIVVGTRRLDNDHRNDNDSDSDYRHA